MEGQPHLMDCEILEYESFSNMNHSDISNDDDDSDDDMPNQSDRFQPATNGHRFGKAMNSMLRRTSTPTTASATTTTTTRTNGHSIGHRLNRVELSEDDDD